MRQVTKILLFCMFLLFSFAVEGIMAEELIPDKVKDNLAVYTVPDVNGSTSTVKIEAHSEFFLRLKSNISTGYSWEIAQPLDQEKIEFAGKYDDNQPEQDPEIQPLLGAPGFEVLKFKAHGHSHVSIELKLIRPWEKDVEPQKKVTIAVTIGNGE